MNPEDIKIPRREFGSNPFLTREGCIRAAAELEAARDMCKEPEQLLSDIHEETISLRSDSLHRALARHGSLILRNERATEILEARVRKVAYWGIGFAIAGLLFSGVQIVQSALGKESEILRELETIRQQNKELIKIQKRHEAQVANQATKPN